jgi:hypothetical protein
VVAQSEACHGKTAAAGRFLLWVRAHPIESFLPRVCLPRVCLPTGPPDDALQVPQRGGYGKKRKTLPLSFGKPFYAKSFIILPGQARDKHGESIQNSKRKSGVLNVN